jgi:bifunctional pyridoxal-dependent enzyme with beta-cystathionase and maltose regulon repressor activities
MDRFSLSGFPSLAWRSYWGLSLTAVNSYSVSGHAFGPQLRSFLRLPLFITGTSMKAAIDRLPSALKNAME